MIFKIGWDRLKKANLIVQPIAGLLTIVGIGWAAVQGVSLPSMPLWSLLALGVAVFAGGVAFGRSMSPSSRSRSVNVLHSFDYRDFWPPIEQRGWKVHGSKAVAEIVEIVADTEFGKVARVDLASGVAIDRLLRDECRSAGALEFIGDLGTLYANVVIRSSSVP